MCASWIMDDYVILLALCQNHIVSQVAAKISLKWMRPIVRLAKQVSVSRNEWVPSSRLVFVSVHNGSLKVLWEMRNLD